MQEFIITPNQPSPEIVVPNCLGDLRVLGWDQPDVRVEARGSAGDVTTEQQNGRVAISSRSDVTLHVPNTSSLTVGAAHGDTRVQGIQGRIRIESAHSELVLRDVGPVQVGAVNGDLSAKGVAGGLEASVVQGDAVVRGIQGLLTLGRVNGDLSARALEAGGRAEDVQGDISLSTSFTPGAEYRFRAQGDLVCRIEPDANARIEVRCRGDFRSAVPGLMPARSGEAMTVTLGAGEATVVLEAMGDVLLRPDDERSSFDFNVGIQVDVDKIRREVEHIRRQAIREAGRARREAERTAAHARRHARGFGRLGQWFSLYMDEPEARPAPGQSAASDEPVTDEERLAILRMVQNGQISAAEAAKLLEALEG